MIDYFLSEIKEIQEDEGVNLHRGRGHWAVHWSTKSYNNVFLIVALTTLDSSVNFDWLDL